MLFAQTGGNADDVICVNKCIMSAQDALRQAWLAGKEGGLSAREQAKAWALRELWLADGKGAY
eukprot:1546337-Karenia_brevis.AAC.1